MMNITQNARYRMVNIEYRIQNASTLVSRLLSAYILVSDDPLCLYMSMSIYCVFYAEFLKIENSLRRQ